MSISMSHDNCRKKPPISLIYRYVGEILGISWAVLCLIWLIRPKNMKHFLFFHKTFLWGNQAFLKFYLLLKWQWHIWITDLNVTLWVVNFPLEIYQIDLNFPFFNNTYFLLLFGFFFFFLPLSICLETAHQRIFRQRKRNNISLIWRIKLKFQNF